MGFSFVALIIIIFYMPAHNSESDSETTSFVSKTHEVCRLTVQISKVRVVNIVNLIPGLSVGPLIQKLHDDSITTVLTDDYHGLKICPAKEEVKNILFILDNLKTVLNLIMHSSRVFSSTNWNLDMSWVVPKYLNPEYHKPRKLPNYCIDNPLLMGNDSFHSDCDYRINITPDELEDESILSDHVFNSTRSLYINKVWNSNNYIIFMIPNLKRVEVPELQYLQNPLLSNDECRLGECHEGFSSDGFSLRGEQLTFIFNFIWRFFRGRKVVMCTDICYNYDPFIDRIQSYVIGARRKYFDFSCANFHGKEVTLYIRHNSMSRNFLWDWSSWIYIFTKALSEYGRSVNAPFAFHSPEDFIAGLTNLDDGQKFGVDTFVFNGNIDEDEENQLSEMVHLASIESLSLCIVTPRPGFMPKYLAIFKIFTPVGWFLVCLTAVVFFVMQFLFQRIELLTFSHRYSERGRYLYKETSALLTIYAYFFSGNPPVLLLGQQFTGRVLFTTFIFSSFVIMTLFQSKMVTLLSDSVRSPDLETVEDLMESGLFIQSSDIKTDRNLFTLGDSHFEALIPRLTSSVMATSEFLYSVSLEDEHFNDYQIFAGIEQIDNFTFGLDTLEMKNAQALRSSLISTMQSDAFLVNIPVGLFLKDDVVISGGFHGNRPEYHRLKKCVLTYPFAFRVFRNLFFLEGLNNKLVQLLESGHTLRWTQEFKDEDGDFLGLSSVDEDKKEDVPKPFSMSDLQPAFIALVLGLLLSYFAFVGELLKDLLKDF